MDSYKNHKPDFFRRVCKGILFSLLLFLSVPSNGKLAVAKLTCNYQRGFAVTEGDVFLGWQMVSDVNGDAQTAFQLRIIENYTNKKIYDSGKTKSDQSQHISIPNLPRNKYGYYWQVRVWDVKNKVSEWSEVQSFRIVPTGFSAKWISAITKKASRIPEEKGDNKSLKIEAFNELWRGVDTLSSRSIIMRKEFDNAGRQIADAVVYVSGLGHYEMSINGKKVGDSVFAPLWSGYDKTIYYNTYDVTDLVVPGDNAISVMLGNGFLNVQKLDRYAKIEGSFGPPQLFLQLEINYTDGSGQVITSDTDWKYFPSPITFNSIYGGESFDARLCQSGYDKAGFDDSNWRQTIESDGPKGTLTPQTAPPVKIMEYYGVKSWHYIPADSLSAASKVIGRVIDPTAFVADMGQNLAGFPEITIEGKRGQKVTLWLGERLTPQGACDQRIAGSPHYYEYTLGADGVELWHPRFSYFGFRFIQVEGAVMEGEPNPNGLPVIKNLQSCFIYDSAEEVSSFKCSNPLFTNSHRIIERAERSNMQGVLTDCPHREKLGWLEQDHLCGPSLLYNYDMTAYVPKIIKDIVDAQEPNGMIPTIAPRYVAFNSVFDDSPEWGSTLVILPFMYYEQYGDNSLIINNYEVIRDYVDYLTSRSEEGIVSHGLGDWCDHGPWNAGRSRNTPVPLVATTHYIYDLQLMVEAARMIGNKADVDKYSALLKYVTDSFNEKFYKPDLHTYGSGSQASNALPLYLGLTGENRQDVLQSLINDIEEHGNRLTTGDVGNRYLFQALSMNGCDEILYNMLNHDDVPGYGYQLKIGSTTLTERWDPLTGASRNHFMMGQVDEWLFKTVAGIQNQPGTVGLKHLLIKPQLVGDLKYVKATTASLYGKISVDCTTTSLSVEIPVGSDATIILSDGSERHVSSGKYSFTF